MNENYRGESAPDNIPYRSLISAAYSARRLVRGAITMCLKIMEKIDKDKDESILATWRLTQTLQKIKLHDFFF